MRKTWCVLLILALIIAFYGCSTAGDEKKKIYSDDELKEGSHMVVLPEGKYRFKIVGNNASGEIKIDLALGEEMKSTAVED